VVKKLPSPQPIPLSHNFAIHDFAALDSRPLVHPPPVTRHALLTQKKLPINIERLLDDDFLVEFLARSRPLLWCIKLKQKPRSAQGRF